MGWTRTKWYNYITIIYFITTIIAINVLLPIVGFITTTSSNSRDKITISTFDLYDSKLDKFVYKKGYG